MCNPLKNKASFLRQRRMQFSEFKMSLEIIKLFPVLLQDTLTITGHSNSSTTTGHSNSSTTTGHSNSSTTTGHSNSSTTTGHSNSSTTTGHSNSSTTTRHSICVHNTLY